MPKTTTLAERIEIMEKAQAGETDPHQARRLAYSVSTIRKWRRRAQRGGRAALASRMGRPRRGALSTYPAALRLQLQQWRQMHPGWGAKTLHAELTRLPDWDGQPIPSVSSIQRFLREQGGCRTYQRHHDLPQSAPVATPEPQQVWEMDARGYERVAGVGYVSLIDLNDRGSHVRLLSYPCVVGQTRWQRPPNTEDYLCALRLAFTEWGLPQQVQVDHDSVFYDNWSASPFPTRLHLWLRALGIELRFGRINRPQDQGMTERSHQLWFRQCLQGQTFDDWSHLYHTLQTRRRVLNEDLGCGTLGNLSPLQAFPTARRSPRPYRPEWEADLLELTRVWDYLAQGRWYRRVGQNGTISLGQQVYYVGHPQARQEVEVTFEAATQHLQLWHASGTLLNHAPIQGLTKRDLMGSLHDHFNLPHFQRALPFEGEAQALVRLFAHVGGTT